MNQDIKKKWVDALRSGNYKQGYRALKNGNNKYCCLGVLCDLAVREGVAKEDYVYSSSFFDGESAFLPASVIEWSNFNSSIPSVEYEGMNHWLSVLNDDKRLTFNEIADLIEEQL